MQKKGHWATDCPQRISSASNIVESGTASQPSQRARPSASINFIHGLNPIDRLACDRFKPGVLQFDEKDLATSDNNYLVKIVLDGIDVLACTN